MTWSPPVNNNPLIDGYEVFYGVCDCKTFSAGVTNYTKLIVSGLWNAQNYIFCMTSYSNEEHTLPSEWSDVATLIEGNLTNVKIHAYKFFNLFSCVNQQSDTINSQRYKNLINIDTIN